MLVQKKLNINLNNVPIQKKKKRTEISSYNKNDKIKQILAEWNTIKDVELYEELYNIYCRLFYVTQNKKLSCLNYYIDHERDNELSQEYTIMYAEIKDTWQLEMKDRYKLHKELLERVMSNDTTLSYCQTTITQVDEGQLSLFG